MRKQITVSVVLVLVTWVVQAHEFWMYPDKFRFKPGESITVNFQVGENFVGEPWDLKRHRFERLELVQKTKKSDIRKSVTEGEKDNLKIALKEEGTHMIVMESNEAFISLEAKKFNDYLEEDGLDEPLRIREKTNTLNDSSKEYYSRHTKLLFQVGSKTDDTFSKVIGLPIEIVPDRNPYDLKVGNRIAFKILFNGKPLFGAKVRLWNRYNNTTILQNIYSQQDGTIEATISNPGAWMVSVVNMVPSKNPRAQWKSFWGSLVFGIQ
jgi:uncharacterized GH25 family protein